jgi:hypothetical protein
MDGFTAEELSSTFRWYGKTLHFEGINQTDFWNRQLRGDGEFWQQNVPQLQSAIARERHRRQRWCSSKELFQKYQNSFSFRDVMDDFLQMDCYQLFTQEGGFNKLNHLSNEQLDAFDLTVRNIQSALSKVFLVGASRRQSVRR